MADDEGRRAWAIVRLLQGDGRFYQDGARGLLRALYEPQRSLARNSPHQSAPDVIGQ